MGQRQDTIRKAGQDFQRDFLNGQFKTIKPEQQNKHYLLFALGYWGIYKGKLPTNHPQYSPYSLEGYEDCFLTGYELELNHDSDVTKKQLVIIFNEVFRNGRTSTVSKKQNGRVELPHNDLQNVEDAVTSFQALLYTITPLAAFGFIAYLVA